MTKPNHLTLKQAFKHLCVREYMTGVARTKDRVKATGEVFTPDALVIGTIEKLIRDDPTLFQNYENDLLDPSCGDGQFLSWLVIFKLCKGDLSKLHTDEACSKNIYNEFIKALRHVYGVDLMADNVAECYKRLSCGFETRTIRKILKNNVRCENSLTYDFSFS